MDTTAATQQEHVNICNFADAAIAATPAQPPRIVIARQRAIELLLIEDRQAIKQLCDNRADKIVEYAEEIERLHMEREGLDERAQELAKEFGFRSGTAGHFIESISTKHGCARGALRRIANIACYLLASKHWAGGIFTGDSRALRGFLEELKSLASANVPDLGEAIAPNIQEGARRVHLS